MDKETDLQKLREEHGIAKDKATDPALSSTERARARRRQRVLWAQIKRLLNKKAA